MLGVAVYINLDLNSELAFMRSLQAAAALGSACEKDGVCHAAEAAAFEVTQENQTITTHTDQLASRHRGCQSRHDRQPALCANVCRP